MRIRTLLASVFAAALVLAGIQTAQAASPFTVTASTTTPAITLGGTFVLKGGVYPNAKGKTVSIQKFTGGTWKTQTTATLSTNSYYSKTLKPTVAGNTYWRVYKAASGGRLAAVSPTVKVTTSRWQYVRGAFHTTQDPPTVYEGTVAIKGNLFPSSYSLLQGESMTVDISGRGCTRFKAYIGVDDDSVGGTTGTAYLTDGGFGLLDSESSLAKGQHPRFMQTTSLGTSGTLAFVPVVSSSDPQHAWVTYGAPQLYCAS